MKALLTVSEQGVYFARYVVTVGETETLFLNRELADKYAARVGGEVFLRDVDADDLWIEGLYFDDTAEAYRALEMGQAAYERGRRRTPEELIRVLGTDLVKERLARMQVEKQLKVLGQSVVALRVANMQGGKA